MGSRSGSSRDHPHGLRLGELRTGDLSRRLRTPDRKVRLWHEEVGEQLRAMMNAPMAVGGEYPFLLIGRRDLRSANSWLHNIPRLMAGRDRCRLYVHPDDVAAIGARDGEWVLVRSSTGQVETELVATSDMMPGVVSLPHGWGHYPATNRTVASRRAGVSYNDLADERRQESIAGMAFLNGIAVCVEPMRSEPRR